MYGKACQQKRSVGFFSNACIGYEYSGQKIKALAMLDWMNELIEYVNCKFGAEFNGILVNKYANGEEYMARHSDDECELDLAAGVVMISIGAVRTFRIRDKRTGAIRLNVLTHPGRMIQMSGEFQREFVHEIPVERKVSSARYSLTFRRHKARVF
jgi:alkylated DNA repair dioxygenase AlkB